tara:strand:- start:930 stop:1790 length:861 start_codon:yes stop_codon:yes gene_type:complete
MPNPALDTVIDLVRAATQLEFEHSLIEEPGWNIDAIRLNTEQIHESGFRDPLFDIGIIGEPNYARVFLRPDQYAGSFVQSIQNVLSLNPDLWYQFLQSSQIDGVDTVLDINHERVEINNLPSWRWRTFQIESKKRIPMDQKEKRPDYLKDVIVNVLGMILVTDYLTLENEPENELGLPEGASSTIVVNKYERSRANRLLCIKHHGTQCWACEMNFSDIYGKFGEGYIEVHHVTPLAEIKKEYVPDCKRDLIPLCSNCHSMIHRKREKALSPHELRELLNLPFKEIK